MNGNLCNKKRHLKSVANIQRTDEISRADTSLPINTATITSGAKCCPGKRPKSVKILAVVAEMGGFSAPLYSPMAAARRCK